MNSTQHTDNENMTQNVTLDDFNKITTSMSEKDIKMSFMENYAVSRRMPMLQAAKQQKPTDSATSQFPAVYKRGEWVGKTPQTLLNEFVQKVPGIKVDYEKLSTDPHGPHLFKVIIDVGQDRLEFQPSQPSSKQKEAKQNAALEFIKYISEAQLKEDDVKEEKGPEVLKSDEGDFHCFEVHVGF